MSRLDAAPLEALQQQLRKLQAACNKDRHALLKAAVTHAITYLSEHATLEDDESTANVLIYPLKLGLELPKDEALVPLALQPLQYVLALGLVRAEYLYKPPDVVVSEKSKKSLLPSNGRDDAQRTGNAEPPTLSSLILTLLRAKALSTVEEVQLLALRSLLTAVTSSTLAVHGKSLLDVVETMYEAFLYSKHFSAQSSAKSSLSHLIGAVQQRAEASEANDEVLDEYSDASQTQPRRSSQLETPSEASLPMDTDDTTANGIDFHSASERDCFMLVRSLSKLASKPVEDEGPRMSAQQVETTVQSQLLSLTLLHHFIVNVGTTYAKTPSFRYAMRKYICRSLVLNCASTHVETARVALEMVVTLVLDYRVYLKKEIAVMFFSVLFPVLHSTNSSFGLRHAILTSLELLLRRPDVVMDIFINYDCGIGWPDVMQQVLHYLTREVHTHHVVPNWITPKQDEQLRQAALSALTGLLKSLIEWSSRTLKEAEEGDPIDATADVMDEPSPPTRAAPDESECGRMLRDKRSVEYVVSTFRHNVKDGLQAAIDMGLMVDMSPSSIAQFFMTNRELDKVRMGEFLSPDKPLNRETLQHFVELHNFEGMELDEAIRLFIGKFKIVGEAQTVDRTMERLASWYCAQNPNAFSNSGVAYVLSFSIMMLNTDAHSAHVKNKMSLQEFIRNNRGIDDGKDLSTEYLSDVYHRIVHSEIVLEGTPQKTAVRRDPRDAEDDPLFTFEKKQDVRYKRESDSLVRDVATRLDDEPSLHKPPPTFHTARGIDAAAGVWSITWGPLLPALSVTMESANDEHTVELCLEGFELAIHLTTLIETPTERAAFLIPLCGFTHLNGISEITPRNVLSIRTLIRVAEANGNFLGGMWYEVLKCISLLDGLHILRHSKDVSSMTRRHEYHNAEMVSTHISQALLDRVFSKSAELNGAAVVALVECLCRVSAEELKENPPRFYSLERLVEVTEANIERIRYVWGKMWVHLSRHFIGVGLESDTRRGGASPSEPTPKTALFIVNSLRQLAARFLARRELGHFHFQRDVLKPFEVIAVNARDSAVHELIVESIASLVEAHHDNILSGWKTVLYALARCAEDSSVLVVQAACGTLQFITRNYMRHFASSEGFCDIVMVWSLVAASPLSVVAECAILHLELLGWMLRVGVPPKALVECDNGFGLHAKSAPPMTYDELQSLVKLLQSADPEALVPMCPAAAKSNAWLSLFAAMSSLIAVRVEGTPRRALYSLLGELTQHGELLSDAEWMLALEGALFPVFLNIFGNVDLGIAGDDASRGLLEEAAEGLVHLVQAYPRLLSQFASFVELLLQGPACGTMWTTIPTFAAVEALASMDYGDAAEQRWSFLAVALHELQLDLCAHLNELEGVSARAAILSIAAQLSNTVGRLSLIVPFQNIVPRLFAIVVDIGDTASRVALGGFDDANETVGLWNATAQAALPLIEPIGPDSSTHRWVDTVLRLYSHVGGGELRAPSPVVRATERVAKDVVAFLDRHPRWWEHHYPLIVRLVEVESSVFRAALAEALSHHPPAPRDDIATFAEPLTDDAP